MSATGNHIFSTFLRPRLSYGKQVARFCRPKYSKALRGIQKHVQGQHFNTSLECIVYIRNWINTNSIHLIDSEHDKYAFDVPKTIAMMYECAIGGKTPHLSCGPRAYAMKEVLRSMGMESRIIDIFELRGEPHSVVNAHTLIEVYDNTQSRWILQDPDFNVSYTNRVTRQPTSVREALELEKEHLTFETNGHDVENPINLENTINNLFEHTILYRHSYTGTTSELFIKEGHTKILLQPVQDLGRTLTFGSYLTQRDPTLSSQVNTMTKEKELSQIGTH